MNQILIPCCQSKITGGVCEYQTSDVLQDRLKPSTYRYLMGCRKDLTRILALIPGRDLGFDEHASVLRFMPAIRRYNGNLYRSASLDTTRIDSDCHRLTIISALYGLIDSTDLIREYELAMDDHLPNGSRVYRWWKDRQLGDIVAEYMRQDQPATIHDILSISYRKALGPWPPSSLQGVVRIYQYPGKGSAKSEETASRTITFDSSVQEISFDLFLGTTKQTIPLTVALSKDRATIAEFSMSPDPMQTGVRIYLRRPLFEPSGGNFVLNVSQDGTLRDVPIRVRLR